MADIATAVGASSKVPEEKRGLSPRGDKSRGGSWPEGDGGARRCCGQCRPCGFRCAALLVVLGALMLLIFSYSIAMLKRFTPVFQPVVCHSGTQTFGDPQIGMSGVALQANATMVCRNPNPYAVTVGSTGPGRVLLLDPARTQVGNVNFDTLALPCCSGKAEMTAQLSLSLSMVTIAWLLVPDHSPAKILLELNTQAASDVGAVVASFHMVKEVAAVCGLAMQVAMSVPPTIQNGPAICGSTFDEIEGLIPAVGSADEVSFSLGPSNEELESIQRSVDGGFGALVVVSGALGITLLALAAHLLLRRHRETKAREAQVAKPEQEEAATQPATIV